MQFCYWPLNGLWSPKSFVIFACTLCPLIIHFSKSDPYTGNSWYRVFIHSCLFLHRNPLYLSTNNSFFLLCPTKESINLQGNSSALSKVSSHRQAQKGSQPAAVCLLSQHKDRTFTTDLQESGSSVPWWTSPAASWSSAGSPSTF